MRTYLFSATGFSPDINLSLKGERNVNFDSFPPFLRVLLMTDGTVTKSLESFFWEPISVANVRQAACKDSNDIDPDLMPIDHEDYLIRHIDLIGESSQNCYLTAVSQFAIDRLPSAIRGDLESMKIGIGEILLGRGLETYRKIVELGASETNDKNIWRRYLIYMCDRPVISITETFNVSVFES